MEEPKLSSLIRSNNGVFHVAIDYFSLTEIVFTHINVYKNHTRVDIILNLKVYTYTNY